jgi:predicted SAM-dependent methyltransferase
MKYLNIGCGNDIRKGWINLDSNCLPGVDVVHNIERLPLPFEDAEFDYVLCQDILEHTEYIPVLKDIYRILKKGGKLEVRVPHFTSVYNFVDPTHKKLFSFRTFEYFVETPSNKRIYYFDWHFQKIVNSRITFGLGGRYLIQPIVNTCELTKRLFESTFLSRIFPASNIIVIMIK